MKNPTCLWCGEDMLHKVRTDEWACPDETCAAKDVAVPLEMTTLPAEVEVWMLEYSFGPDEYFSEPITADWLGYFVSEEVATQVGTKIFSMVSTPEGFHWEAKPVVLKFRGGSCGHSR